MLICVRGTRILRLWHAYFYLSDRNLISFYLSI